MRRRVLMIAAVLVCLAVFPLRVSMAAQEIHLATSTVGGIYYMLGVPISQVLNKYMPEIHVTPEIGTGTVENLRLLGQKKVELGITLPSKGIEAINGTGTFTEKLPIRTLMRLTPVVNLFVVMADSPIRTHEDLKGKRVNLGQPGGLDQNSLTISGGLRADHQGHQAFGHGSRGGRGRPQGREVRRRDHHPPPDQPAPGHT